jgi:oligopeptide transport system substrate-binding protein
VPRLVLPLSAACALLALAGCGRRETPAEAGIRTQTLLLANAAEPQDLDPNVIYAWTDNNIANALFEGLTDIDEANTAAVPAVATSWDVSPDGLVYTFHLRPDARWSDGDPVTASDFVYSFHRELSPNLGATYSYMLWVIRNAEAFNSGKLTDFSQVGAQAIDAQTLRITLAKPTPYLPALAAHMTWFPVHQAAVEKFGKMDQKGTRWTLPGNLVGNGPFVLTEWTPNSRIVVEKSPHYWDAAHVRLNRIIFFPIENAESEELDFRGGGAQVTYGLPISKVAAYRKDHPGMLRIEDNLASYYLFINNKRPPFDNPKLRLALALAIDRVRISRDVCQGIRAPAHCFTPPGCGDYTARASIPDDFVAARKMLAEAGYPGGRGLPTIEVLSYTTELPVKTLEVIQKDWKNELGVRMTIAPIEQKTLFANQQSGNYTIAFSAWIADYPDPSTFLNTLETGNGNNWAAYHNPAYDQLIEAAAGDPDNGRRMEDFQKAEAMMLHDAPLIPLYFGQRPYLIQPYVRGWPPAKLAFKRFKNVWLEK